MKQEPTVWMSPDGKVSTTEGKLFYISLYTAPKQLSDEEIRKLWIGTCEIVPQCEHYLHFARAILKKASEK